LFAALLGFRRIALEAAEMGGQLALPGGDGFA
jgi:hypothetical protein